MKDLHLSWNDVEVAVAMLSVRLYENYMCKIDHIVGIARGGLPIATMLAHKLGVERISTISIQTYGGREKTRSLKDFYLPTYLFPNEPFVLVVDDILDSGETMRVIKKYYSEVLRVCLVAKPDGKKFINYEALNVPQSCWVHFPWENNTF